MADRVPENLEFLYGGFSKNAIDNIFDGESFTVEGVEFVCKYAPESTAERFCIAKPSWLIDEYRTICREFAGGRWFELGIAEGGSTALFALLARPERFVAIDLEPSRLAPLDEFIAARGLATSLRPFFGVNQADKVRLLELVDDEISRPLDVVIDDASHHYEPTVASFEALFPRVREGGIYIVEDWRADHRFRDALAPILRDPTSPHYEQFVAQLRESLAAQQREEAPPPARPLSRLAVQLLLARAGELGNVVAQVTAGRNTLVVRRGPGELDADFAISDLYIDHYGYLTKQ